MSMNRRDFTKSITATSAAIGATALAPSIFRPDTAKAAEVAEQADVQVVSLCRRILEVNRLKEGETVVIATPHLVDEGYIAALMAAVTEIGATGVRVAVIPRETADGRLTSGLTAWHWDLYATADLLITCSIGAPSGTPRPVTAYIAKVGNHPYRTDFEYISRADSKTRWINLGYSTRWQAAWFPTPQLQETVMAAARDFLHPAKELRLTRGTETDLRFGKVGRPGHSQIGFVDAAGRWDNFAYGCANCSPNEDQVDGVVVLEPGDYLPSMAPYKIINEKIKLTWKDGYVIKIEGDSLARQFEAHLAKYNNPQSYGLSHFGYGCHPRTLLGNATNEELSGWHHNYIGTVAFAMGVNYGHGLGGPDNHYSGLGASQNKAPNHTHFTLRDGKITCDGRTACENGRLVDHPTPV